MMNASQAPAVPLVLYRSRSEDAPDRDHDAHQPPRRACETCPSPVRNEVRFYAFGICGRRRQLRRPRRAIENGANALAEGFLFSVAASLIIAEAWRSSRKTTKRREDVDDRIGELQEQMQGLTEKVESIAQDLNEKWEEEKTRCVLPPIFSV